MDVQGRSTGHEAIEILIAEDSPTQAGKLKFLLEGRGYRARIAVNGRLALDAIRLRKPHLVLSDILMPELDGYGLCQAIKAQPELRDLPVILVTSLIDPEDIVRGLECGADNFIRKPYNDDYLLNRIEYVLMNRRLRDGQQDGNGIAVFFNGAHHHINAERRQILDLLISTYEQAVMVNEQLQARERQVNELNVRLAQHAAQLEVTNREIAHQNLQLEQASRLKSEFLANMSHELRTPLNAVIGFSEALKGGLLGPLAPAQMDAIGDVHESGKHLLSLINDILDLSKVEAGKMELELEPTEVQRLIQSTINVLREKASVGQIQLQLQMEAVGWAMVDQRKMRQIIYNLVSNAIKFTPAKGSVVLRMCLMDAADIPATKIVGGEMGAASSVSRFLTIRVTDTGIGINESDCHRLFQPFVQLDSGLARKYEGTGLGLALVKQMVDLHGGIVTLSSEPGRGSEFTVWLPHIAAGAPGIAAPH